MPQSGGVREGWGTKALRLSEGSFTLVDWVPFHTNHTWGKVRHYYAATISGCRPPPQHTWLETVRCLEYGYQQPFWWRQQVHLPLWSNWGTEGKAVYCSWKKYSDKKTNLLYNHVRIRHQHSSKDLGPRVTHRSVHKQRLYISPCEPKHLPMGYFRIYISCCVLPASCEFGGSWETAGSIQARV